MDKCINIFTNMCMWFHTLKSLLFFFPLEKHKVGIHALARLPAVSHSLTCWDMFLPSASESVVLYLKQTFAAKEEHTPLTTENVLYSPGPEIISFNWKNDLILTIQCIIPKSHNM